MVGGALSSTARATLVSHTRELCVRPTGIGRTKDPERRQKPVHLPHVSTEQKTRGLTCRHMTICKVEIKAKTFSCFHLYVSKYNAIIFETLALAHTHTHTKKKKNQKEQPEMFCCRPAPSGRGRRVRWGWSERDTVPAPRLRPISPLSQSRGAASRASAPFTPHGRTANEEKNCQNMSRQAKKKKGYA